MAKMHLKWLFRLSYTLNMATKVVKNPWGIEMIPYEKPIVEFVEALLDVAQQNGSKEQIYHEADWKTMEFMYKGWSILYPKSAADFDKEMKKLRSASTRHAIARDKKGAIMQHKLKVPRPFYQMMQTIWRHQEFDERFVNEFARRFPAFKITKDSL